MHVLLQREGRGNLSVMSVCFGNIYGARTRETNEVPCECRDMGGPPPVGRRAVFPSCFLVLDIKELIQGGTYKKTALRISEG
jgi:hypothetical protein